MGKANYTKRITMRTVGLAPEELEKIALENKSEVAVLRVVGRISSVEAGTTQIGPFTKFKGEFAAINLTNGEETRSMTCILPGPAELLCSKLVEAAKKSDANAIAQFGCDVTVKEHKSTYNSGWKFTYGVKSLVDIPAEDALTLLAKQFGAVPLLEDKEVKSKKK